MVASRNSGNGVARAWRHYCHRLAPGARATSVVTLTGLPRRRAILPVTTRAFAAEGASLTIDLRAASYPSLLEAVGLAIVQCHGMEQSIPRVFQAALNTSIPFHVAIFEATRGLEVHLKVTEAAIREGAPAFVSRWLDVANLVRATAVRRGKVAHSGLSVYGGGIIIEVDEDGTPTGFARRAGPPVASLQKPTKQGPQQITEAEVREVAQRALEAQQALAKLATDIAASR